MLLCTSPAKKEKHMSVKTCFGQKPCIYPERTETSFFVQSVLSRLKRNLWFNDLKLYIECVASYYPCPDMKLIMIMMWMKTFDKIILDLCTIK